MEIQYRIGVRIHFVTQLRRYLRLSLDSKSMFIYSKRTKVFAHHKTHVY